jgi:HK97 family phage portal protein
MAILKIGSWSWPRTGTGSSHSDNFVREPYYVGGSRSGVEVTREVMWQTSALLCAARVISQGVAQVPLKLFDEANSDGRTVRKPARDHSAYRLLADQPNDFMTSFSFRETLILHAVLDKGGFAYINRRSDGTVREFLPIAPDDIEPTWDKNRRELFYRFGTGANEQRLRPDQVLHIHGPSWDGYSGMPALQMAREAIGLSVSLERGQSDTASRGFRPSGVLSSSEKISPEAANQIRDRWQSRFGPGGEGGIAVLDGGWSFGTMQMSAVDAQYIETRKFQIEEIARFTMVFPQMLMTTDTPTYASAEQFFLAHVVHTLDPWMDRVEQEIKRSVIGYGDGNADIYPRFIREGLLRGAAKDRSEFYAKALGSGGTPAWMTQNEVRERENLNPLDDPAYDALPIPLNSLMQPAEEPTNDA